MASTDWTPKGPNVPDTVEQLRHALTQLAMKRSGKALIDPKFTRDHLYPGHKGSLEKLAVDLSSRRGIGKSTLVLSSMETQARDEVLNWIKKAPAAVFTYSNGTWTVSNRNSTVAGTYRYNYATVDADALKRMNRDDVVKKSRNWLTVTENKLPHFACLFDTDGTPVIYHLDF
ncbi:MAG: hypothetical protein ACRYFU_12195 [Janthinobacterium lividum]